MRTIIRIVAALALAACAPGRVIVVHRPAPPPPPPPPRIEPLEVAVARPVRGHLLVQTSRPAYVAIFEIVPDRGVALIAPTYVHQRTWMLAGLNWVPVSWKVQSTMYYGPPSAHGVPGRYVYAIASDEPLRLPDEAFRPEYLKRALGPTVYRSRNPYLTMRALSRLFVPAVVDEAWAEDAYVLAATYASDPYRTVRIYCANRTVYEVPEELADRAWCPVTQRNTGGGTAARNAPSRPDSVVASNGHRVRRRVPETRTVYRVREPSTTPGTPVTDDTRGNPPVNNGNNAGNNTNVGGNNAGSPNENAAKDSSRARRGRGNAYGHTDDPTVRGRGVENQKEQRQTPPAQNDKGRPRDKELEVQTDAPPSNSGNDPRREPRVDEKPVHQHERPNEPKPDEKRLEKQEHKQEQKREEKPAEKAADRPEDKQPEQADRQPPKQDDVPPVDAPRESKPEAKPEKTDPGVQQPQAEKQEAKPDKPDAKPEPKGEGDAKGQGKQDNKVDAKGAKGQQAGPDEPDKKDQKGKP